LIRPLHGLLALLVALQAGCISRTDVERVPAPEYPLDAVLVERNGGATTSFSYEVHIVSRGESPSLLFGRSPVMAIWSGCADRIALEWGRPNLLIVKCDEPGHISDFSNRWAGPDAAGSYRRIEVRVQSPAGATPALQLRDFYR
jgi:hypothetical protein